MVYRALIETGDFDHLQYRVIFIIRWIINNLAFPTILWFLFTIDNDLEERAFDLVRDFASLMILVELDNLMAFEDPVPNYDITENIKVIADKKKEEEYNLDDAFKRAVDHQ